jgi:lysophospholipid acyltransferase (LPLAT)-like uncharacterized protein
MSVPINPVTSSNSPPDTSSSSTASPPSPDKASRGKADDVETLRDRVYSVSDISHYRIVDKLIIRAADLLLYGVIRVLCSTLRWEVYGRENLDRVLAGGHRPILTFWHVGIVSATWFWRNRGIVVMSSVSRDAEYTGRVIKRFGYGTARGSATRGGGRALSEMARCLANGMEVAFTIDGPRGPAYVAKPGAVTLARHSAHPILPFHIAVKSCVELPSWDRLQIPLPFTKAACFIGQPIYVARDETSEEVSAKQVTLQSILDNLRGEGERWRAKSDSSVSMSQ